MQLPLHLFEFGHETEGYCYIKKKHSIQIHITTNDPAYTIMLIHFNCTNENNQFGSLFVAFLQPILASKTLVYIIDQVVHIMTVSWCTSSVCCHNNNIAFILLPRELCIFGEEEKVRCILTQRRMQLNYSYVQY